MINNNPTQILENEHTFIMRVISVLKLSIDQLASGHQISTETLNAIVDFMRNYADRCHHGKEEAILFPYLIEKGVPSEGCPIGALTHEHVRGRELVRSIADNISAYQNGDEEARKVISDAINGIIKLYPNHIWKEDYLLFPMVHKVCNANELVDLFNRFNASDEQFGRDAILQYEKFAEEK